MTITLVITLLIVLVLGFLAWRVRSVFRQVPVYKAYWEELAKQPAGKEDILYVVLGDSAAQAVGAARPDQGYVAQVATRLEQKYGKTIHIINLSVSGATAKDALEKQIPQLNELDIDEKTILTTEIGANDMSNFEPKKFENDMRQFMATLPKQTVISTLPYFGGSIFPNREKNVETANEIIRPLAKEYGLRLAELHKITKERDSWRIYSGDFFHPNQRGYKNWADAFWEIIEQQ